MDSRLIPLSALMLLLMLSACSKSDLRREQRQFENHAEDVLEEEIKKTSYRVASIPTSVDEYLAFRDEHSDSASGGAAAFALALVVYSQNQELGLKCLTIGIHPEFLQDSDQAGSYKSKLPRNSDLQAFASRIGEKPWVALSYLRETSPESAYELGDGPFTIVTGSGRSVGDDERLYVYSTGADRPRPIRLRESNNGYWKAAEWSSLTTGVKEPKDLSPDDL